MTRHVAPLLLAALLLGSGVARAQQDSTFMSDGVELHYRSAGTGTPAVLLSGGPGSRVDYMIRSAIFLPAGYRLAHARIRRLGQSLSWQRFVGGGPRLVAPPQTPNAAAHLELARACAWC